MGTPFSEDNTSIISFKQITPLKTVIKIVWFNFATIKFFPCHPQSAQSTALRTLRWQQLLDTRPKLSKCSVYVTLLAFVVLASPFYRWENLEWKWCCSLSKIPILKPELHVTDRVWRCKPSRVIGSYAILNGISTLVASVTESSVPPSVHCIWRSQESR